jgi:hypothetical protein
MLDGGDHNHRETPLFAASIEREAMRSLRHSALRLPESLCDAEFGESC